MKKTLVLTLALVVAFSIQLFAAQTASGPSPVALTAAAPQAAPASPLPITPDPALASTADGSFARWLTTNPCGPFGCQHGAGVCCPSLSGYYCDLSGTCA